MDSGQPSQPILDTLRTVEFRLGIKGYNVDEVDEYLEKAALEAERVQEQFRQTLERLRQATERIAQLESAEPAPAATAAAQPVAEVKDDGTLQRMLVMAQRFVDEAKRESEAEAARVLGEAQKRAEAAMSRAEQEARQLVTESQQSLRDEVSRLEETRGQLANDVESMARHLETERNRLRTMLSEVLKWVEENVQPAESLMGMRPRTTEQARNQPADARSASRVGRPPRARSGVSQDGGNAENGMEETGDDTVAQVLDLRGPTPAGVTTEPRS